MKKYSSKQILAFTAVFAGVALFYIVFHCPFKWFFGVPCPGCGMLRAVFSLLKLDFSAAYAYHPLVFVTVPVAAYFLLKKLGAFRLSPFIEHIALAVLAVAFGAVYLIRLFGDSPVVKIDFNSSVLHKIFTLILEALRND